MEQQQSLIALFAQLTPWVQALVVVAAFGCVAMMMHAVRKTITHVVTDIAAVVWGWRAKDR